MPRCCGISLHRARVRSATCCTSGFRSTPRWAAASRAGDRIRAFGRRWPRHHGWLFESFADSRALRAEMRLFFQKRVRVERYRRDGVVDVVSDSARHLPQRAQTLLLHDGLLGLAQLIIGGLKGAVELSLMRSESDMFAQLTQKLALVAAEAAASRRAAMRTPKYFALHQQWNRDQCPAVPLSPTLRERNCTSRTSRFVAQPPPACSATGRSCRYRCAPVRSGPGPSPAPRCAPRHRSPRVDWPLSRRCKDSRSRLTAGPREFGSPLGICSRDPGVRRWHG